MKKTRKRSKKNNKFITLEKILGTLWLVTIGAFLTTAEPRGSERAFPQFLTNTLLINILIGVIMFTAFMGVGFTKYKKKLFSIKIPIIIGIIYFLFYLSVMTVSGHGILVSLSRPVQQTTTTTLPVITSPTSVSVSTTKAVNVNSDPTVNCILSDSCGGGSRLMKKSQCDNMTCCLIDAKCGGPRYITKTQCSNSYCCWLSDGTGATIMNSKSECDKYYLNSLSNKTTSPSYPPCTVYYPVLGYSQTYNYTSPETCRQWQESAKSGNTNTAMPTQPPAIPTQDNSEYNELLKKHEEACKAVVAEWYLQVQNFETNEFNNYTSSYEAIQELERRRQAYQQEMYSVGCYQTISL